MLRLSFFLIFVIALSSSLAQSADTTIAPPPETTSTASTTTTEKSTPSTTTTTTTTTPKTTHSTTTATTPAPVTTTTAKPDVQPWPKNVGHWFLNDTKTNISCLVIDAAFQVTVTYENVENKTVTGTIDIPKNAIGSGTCSDETADLTISWPATSNDTNSLDLKFEKDSKGQGVFGLSQINLTVTPVFSDVKEKRTMSIVAQFKEQRFRTPLNKSYTCMKEPPIPVGNSTSFILGLKVGKLQVEAFRSTVFDKFSPEFECSADDVSAVVPFAVGASLALLVVIVLIAYLIGRRRSRARGYQSV